jgi:hypothetical protein
MIVAVSMGIAIAGGAVASAGPPDTITQELQVPAGNRNIAEMQGTGVQTYRCTSKGWNLVQPDAILTSNDKPVVLHSVGPVWTSVIDGSSVTAEVLKTGKTVKDIPTVLLKATSHRGTGQLSKVTFIQRTNTKGGLAPAGTCQLETTTSVSYSAKYIFWAPTGT